MQTEEVKMGPTRICRQPRAGRRGHPKPRGSFIRNVTFASLAVLGSLLTACTARTVSTVPKESEETIVVPLNWKKGEVFHYVVTTTKPAAPKISVPDTRPSSVDFSLAAGTPPKVAPTFQAPARTQESPGAGTETTKEDLTMEVVKADASGYLVAWNYKSSVSKEMLLDLIRRAAAGETVDLTTSFAADTKSSAVSPDQDADPIKALGFVFSFDPAGNPTGIENWKQIGGLLMLAYQAASNDMEKMGAEYKGGLDKALSMGRSLAGSREGISSYYGKEADPFFAFFGRTLPLSRPIETESQFMNPLTGEPISCRFRIEARSVDRVSRRAVIAWTKTLDPAQFRKLMEKFAVEFLGETFDKMSNDETGKMLKDALSKMSMEEHGELELDLVTGWPDRSSHTTTVEIPVPGLGGRDETTTSIERVPSERRQKGA